MSSCQLLRMRVSSIWLGFFLCDFFPTFIHPDFVGALRGVIDWVEDESGACRRKGPHKRKSKYAAGDRETNGID